MSMDIVSDFVDLSLIMQTTVIDGQSVHGVKFLSVVLVLLNSLVRTLRENATVWEIMSGLLNRSVGFCHHTVVSLVVAYVVMVAVGGSVGKVIEGVLSACQDDCLSIKVEEEFLFLLPSYWNHNTIISVFVWKHVWRIICIHHLCVIDIENISSD